MSVRTYTLIQLKAGLALMLVGALLIAVTL